MAGNWKGIFPLVDEYELMMVMIINLKSIMCYSVLHFLVTWPILLLSIYSGLVFSRLMSFLQVHNMRERVYVCRVQPVGAADAAGVLRRRGRGRWRHAADEQRARVRVVRVGAARARRALHRARPHALRPRQERYTRYLTNKNIVNSLCLLHNSYLLPKFKWSCPWPEILEVTDWRLRMNNKTMTTTKLNFQKKKNMEQNLKNIHEDILFVI